MIRMQIDPDVRLISVREYIEGEDWNKLLGGK
jgi:hypothetical protein